MKKTPFSVNYYDNEFSVESVNIISYGYDFNILFDGKFTQGNHIFAYVYIYDSNGYVVAEDFIELKGKTGGPAKATAYFSYLDPGTYSVEIVIS